MASSRVKTKRLRESATEPDTRKRIAARKLLRSKRQGGSTCFPPCLRFHVSFLDDNEGLSCEDYSTFRA